MLPLSASQSVSLDVLNNYNESIARFDACLQHLHGDWASLTMPSHAPLSLVHWGTQVRFCLSDGTQRYEALGVVVARDEGEQASASCSAARPQVQPAAQSPGARASGADTQDLQDEAPAVVPPARAVREVTVRLYQCQPFGERRTGPRRWTRFGVRLAALGDLSASGSQNSGIALVVQDTMGNDAAFLMREFPARPPAETSSETSHICWERGWAVDISAGGMRLRTYECLPLRQRFALQFWLPDAHPRQAVTHACRFEVVGRVLRSQRTRSRASLYESMMCFEQLSPRDGLALSGFLALQSQIPCCK